MKVRQMSLDGCDEHEQTFTYLDNEAVRVCFAALVWRQF